MSSKDWQQRGNVTTKDASRRASTPDDLLAALADPTARLVTVRRTCAGLPKESDGSYTVYTGDEPDDDGAGTSADNANAMGSGGAGAGAMGGGSSGGQSADSVGAAVKLVLDILQADKSSEGLAGNSDDQLAARFSADKSPTPASGPTQKY